MSTTEKTGTDRAWERIQRVKECHDTIIHFLYMHGDLLVSLSEGAMSDKFGDVEDVPHVSYYTSESSIHMTVYGPNQRDTMRTIRKTIGGEWRKGGYGEVFSLNRYWGKTENGRIYLSLSGERQEVCQKIVTGTKTVEVPEVAFEPARTETVEEVEWVCGNLLED